MRVVSNSDFRTVCENAKKTTGKIISKNFAEDAPAGQKIFTLKGESVEDTVKTLVFWKIVESGRKIYELRAAVIEAYSDEFTEKIKTMLESFSVK